MYTYSIMEAPVTANRIEVTFASDTILCCMNCGCRFHDSHADTRILHVLNLKDSKPVYRGMGLEEKRCPACKGENFMNVNLN